MAHGMAAGADVAEWARRRLPLQGGRNFRDLGGYAGAGGRTVRWGTLFRSGSMADLTDADIAHIAGLGLRTICDLRSTGERDHAPTPAAALEGRNHWCRDYPTSFADLRALMAGGLATPAEARAAMLAGYRLLPFDQAPAYAEIFRRLLAAEVPLAFHCSAGKDRAGTAAALVLTALGVSRADVLADYALTAHADLAEAFRRSPSARAGPSLRQPEGVMEAVFACAPDYIAAALDAAEARHGSIDGYLAAELGVGPEERERLRALLLE